MNAEAKSLYFLGESNKLLVPFFQRHYVWAEENWKELLESFKNTDINPFLGALILKKQNGNEFTIIDGQQRLTTITILAKAIYDSLPEDSKTAGSGVRNGIENFLFYRLNSADDFADSHIKIEHSRIDNQDYSNVIASGVLPNTKKIDLDTINDNSSNILKCYKYYCETLQNRKPTELKSLFTSIFDKNRKLLVVIELEKDEANEQTIFDTINRAGVRLSTADIIKNNLFKRLLDKCDSDDELKQQIIEIYQSCWENVFNKTQETCDLWDEERIFGNVKHSNLEFLLYCVACIKWGEDGDMFSKLEAVFNRETSKMSYAELISLVKEIKEYASIFSKFILKFKSDLEDETLSVYFKYNEYVNRLLLILQKFKVQMFYPYIIKRLYDVNQDVTNDELRTDFQKLESFVIRRKISTKGTHDYTSKCYHIIKEGIDYLVESDLSSPDSGISDIDMKRYLSSVNDDSSKMILFCIELYRRKDEAVDVNVLEYKYTLEHIMPRKWEEHWSSVPIIDKDTDKEFACDSEEGKQIRNSSIQSLGNKTLLTCNLNSSLRNADFERKVLGDGEKKPGYKSHTMLLLTKDIVEQYSTDKIWNEERIEKRTQSLYNEFITLWPSYRGQNQFVNPIVIADNSEEPDISHYSKEELADASKLLEAVPYSVNTDDTTSITNRYEDMINMYSQVELIKQLSINSLATIKNYIDKGKIIPDLVIQISPTRTINYFKKERVKEYSEKFGWKIIDNKNITNLFLNMSFKMRMDHSYKPVFLKAFFTYANEMGHTKLSDIVEYFKIFYSDRRNQGLIVEKKDSLFCKKDYSDDDVEKQVLEYPFKRFELMKMMKYNKPLNKIEIDPVIWEQLSKDDIAEITSICDVKLNEYYKRISD